MDDGFEFWKRVDSLRGKSSLTDLAAVMGVKPQSVKNMRSQCKLPRTLMVRALAEYLGTTATFLLEGTTDPAVDIEPPEVAFVRSSPEARALVRAVMRDPALLQALSAVIQSAEHQGVKAR